MLGAPQDAELGTMLVVGVPPASDTSRKKLVPDTNFGHQMASNTFSVDTRKIGMNSTVVTDL